MDNIRSAFSDFNDSVSKAPIRYSGLLGLSIGGSKIVNIPTRGGYVYVRLRDNLSEVVQAFNDKVSPVYDFPVLIERKGNRWYVIGRDDERYESWGTQAPFLPRHGDQHSFNRDGNGGGDPVLVYPDQFMPLLVYPSGTAGAGMLMVAPYILQRENDFEYVGNTGTQNLLVYKPTNANAIIGLVGMDKVTGNPTVLIASGTPMPGTSTGSAIVASYAPYPPSNVEPLYLFRLVSGTTEVNWSNLYNARQFIGGSTSTGTSGGTLPTFVTGSIPYAGSNGELKESNPNLAFDETYKTLWLRGGNRNLPLLTNDQIALAVLPTGTNTTVTAAMLAFGTGTLGSPSAAWNGYRSRGTLLAPTPVQANDAMMSIIGAGYDGSSWINSTRIRLYADGGWITGAYTPSRMDFEVTPSGSTTRRAQFQIYGNAVEIPTGSTYNRGGVPIVHNVQAGTGVTIDNSNPSAPVISATASGGGAYSSIVSLSMTTGSVSAVESTFYVLNISGLTSDQDWNLPTPSASGKFIGVRLSVGDATYELSLKRNGVAVTKIFITGEVVEFVSTGTGAGDWEVYRDGRIPEHGIIERQAAQSFASGGGTTKVQMDTTIKNVGDVVDLSSGTWGIRARRDNDHEIIGVVIFANAFSDQKNIQSIIHLNNVLDTYQITYVSTPTTGQPGMARVIYEKPLDGGDLINLIGFHNQGSAVNTSTTVGYPQLSVKEILNPI